MDIVEIFKSDPDSNASFIKVIEDEEDVGANVILSTASSPPPKPATLRLVKVIFDTNTKNRANASQSGTVAKVSEPLADYAIRTIKDEFTRDDELNDAMSEVTESGGNDITEELTAEMLQPTMKEIVQYELVYAGGPMQQVKVEMSEEDDYVPQPGPVQEFYCGVCGKSYSSEKSVRQHMTRTHGTPAEKKKKKNYPPPKKIVCELCGKKYASSAALRYHQRTHTGEKPFQCTECPKAFTMPLFLQLHWRTHTGERPYPCATCPKAFSNQAALLRHNRVHTGIKPYKCEQCGKAFTQSNSRKLHIRTVHLKLPAPYISKKRRLRQQRKNVATPPESDTEPGYRPAPVSPRRLKYVIESDLLGDTFIAKYKSDDE